MGGGIAQVTAASGRSVLLHDAVPGAAERALDSMRTSLRKLAEKGGADPDEVLSRVEVVHGLVAADLLIEAVVEEATLWVLEDNPRARRFYEAAGWEFDGGREIFSRGGVDAWEIRYHKRLG